MANFVFEKYNSMPEQVEENKKNIKELINIIKPVYKCVGSLNTSSISVAKSLTNAEESTVDGWLLDIDGNLFKITGGDDYSLLLEYYASIHGPQGPQGPSGADGQDGQNGTNGLSIRFSNSSLNTTLGYSTTLLISDIVANDNIEIDDLIIDANGTLGKVFFIDVSTIDVRTIAILMPDVIDDATPSDDKTYSSNKIDSLISGVTFTLYRHNINIKIMSGSDTILDCNLTIYNGNDTLLNGLGAIKNYLVNKGYNANQYIELSGSSNYNQVTTVAIGVAYDSYEADPRLNLKVAYQVASQSKLFENIYNLRETTTGLTITDNCKPI